MNAHPETPTELDQAGASDMPGVVYVSTDQEKKDFIEFPYRHYAGDPNWIPPLKIQQRGLIDIKKNPFYQSADLAMFLAWHRGRPAGRIAAIHNHAYNRYHGGNTGFFGFFECENNPFLCSLLFRVVRDWLHQRGCTRMIGPFNPGLLDEIGIQVSGFEHPAAILMPQSKPWYDELVRSAGLEKEMDLFSYKVTRDTISVDRMQRAVDIVFKRLPGLKVRRINLRKIETEAEIIREIFNKAWAKNWGFYEYSKEDMLYLAKDIKLIADTDFAHIAELDGKPVAFSIALPDYNQVFRKMNGTLFPTGIFKLLWYRRKINGIRTALMGVLPEYRGRGIDVMLNLQAIWNGDKRNFYSSEMGWLLENNTDIIRLVTRIGGLLEKTYRIYSRDIT